MAKKDRLAKLENALVKSYRARPEIEPNSVWSMCVMAQVRGQGRVWNKDNDLVVAQQRFVWRFAAAVCTLAVVISMYAFRLGIGPEQLAMKFFIENPLNTPTMQVFTL